MSFTRFSQNTLRLEEYIYSKVLGRILDIIDMPSVYTKDPVTRVDGLSRATTRGGV
jgi:hypothetical protein